MRILQSARVHNRSLVWDEVPIRVVFVDNRLAARLGGICLIGSLLYGSTVLLRYGTCE